LKGKHPWYYDEFASFWLKSQELQFWAVFPLTQFSFPFWKPNPE
jgi:hypothetical protein